MQDAPTSNAKQPRLASASAWFLWFPLSLEITKAEWRCHPASGMRPCRLRHNAKRLWITPCCVGLSVPWRETFTQTHTQCTLRNRHILCKSRLVRMVCYTWRDVSSGCRTLWALSAWPVSTSSQPSSTEASKPSSLLMWPPVCTACSAQHTA